MKNKEEQDKKEEEEEEEEEEEATTGRVLLFFFVSFGASETTRLSPRLPQGPRRSGAREPAIFIGRPADQSRRLATAAAAAAAAAEASRPRQTKKTSEKKNAHKVQKKQQVPSSLCAFSKALLGPFLANIFGC